MNFTHEQRAEIRKLKKEMNSIIEEAIKDAERQLPSVLAEAILIVRNTQR